MQTYADTGLGPRLAMLDPPPHTDVRPVSQPRSVEPAPEGREQGSGTRAQLDAEPRSPVVRVVRRSAEQYAELVRETLDHAAQQSAGSPDTGTEVDRYA